jgi:hypothetical protein
MPHYVKSLPIGNTAQQSQSLPDVCQGLERCLAGGQPQTMDSLFTLPEFENQSGGESASNAAATSPLPQSVAFCRQAFIDASEFGVSEDGCVW